MIVTCWLMQKIVFGIKESSNYVLYEVFREKKMFVFLISFHKVCIGF